MNNEIRNAKYNPCINACYVCAMHCDNCATACLEEPDIKVMAKCIELDMHCADICRLAASFMSKGTMFAKEICTLCATICEKCGEECSKHKVEHCQMCAEACKRCAEECRKMAA